MRSLKLISKLVTSRMRLHPGRFIITLLGVIASTCAVVWVVSGYDALVSQFDENAGKYLGRYDALVIAQAGGPPGSPPATIDQSLIRSLEQDAGVMEVNPISNSRVSVTRVTGATDVEDSESALGLLVGNRPPVNGAPPVDPTLVSTPAAESPYEMVDGEWFADDVGSSSTIVGVKVAEEMGVAVGDELLVTTFANQMRLKVIGLIEQASQAPSLGERGPGRRGGGGANRAGSQRESRSSRETTKAVTTTAVDQPASNKIGLPIGATPAIATNAIYVRPATAAKMNGRPAHPQTLQIALRDTVTMGQFRNVWQERLAANRPPLQLVDFEAVRRGMESSRSLTGQQSQAWAATGMASLAAIFIIFSTVSMGVSERAREFAMLRAVAMTRSQIAGIIALESVLLALIGWIGGLLAGWLLVLVGSRVLPGLFSSGAVLGWSSVALSGVAVLIGAFGAALLPAWRAMRIQPLDAMQSSGTTQDVRSHSNVKLLGVSGVVGALLILATPIFVFAVPMSDAWKTWCYAFVTYPMLLVGMILMAPAIVIACERYLGPIVNKLFGLDPRMMQTQLTSNLWRTIGATLALSVGLGLYASTQVWGYSMLQPFTPGEWLPDALVAFHPIGLDEDDSELVTQVEEVKSGQAMPLAIEQAKFDWGDAEQPSRLKFGDNGIVCGLDPELAFTGEHPLLPVTFVAGDREQAVAAITSGNGCVVSEDFSMATGLDLGDTVTFIPPASEDERVHYRIAGIVTLPGWQWVTKFSGVRRHFVRTGTLVFANREHVRRDFGLGRTEFFWLNLEPDTDLVAAEAKFQAIAERHAGDTFTADGVGQVTAYRPFARMTATENVLKAINLRADDMIWGMSYLPLVTLVVMSLAVANTIIASVRSRTWEFGVMRSIGVTRSQLVRLMIAETILIAIAACMLSLLFGLVAGWCGVGMAQFGGWFAGPPSFTIPWSQLSIGFALTIALCLLAGLWPAIKTGRAEPLGLLRAGRGTM